MHVMCCTRCSSGHGLGTCAKRLQFALNIKVLYVYEYLVQLHIELYIPQNGRFPMHSVIPKLVLIG